MIKRDLDRYEGIAGQRNGAMFKGAKRGRKAA